LKICQEDVTESVNRKKGIGAVVLAFILRVGARKVRACWISVGARQIGDRLLGRTVRKC
jgi:hypothetical protein